MTRLITTAGDAQVWTQHRETDTHTALARGLAEYVKDLEITINGSRYAFKYVLDHYAEPEELADFPSAAVYTSGPGQYDASSFTPKVERAKFPDGTRIMTSAELHQDLRLELWATNSEERAALCAMVEDALCPVDWRYGPLLELTHYFGARASYEQKNVAYEDDPVEALKRHRKAVFTIMGHVPLTRLIGILTFPAPRPLQLKVEVGEDVSVDP